MIQFALDEKEYGNLQNAIKDQPKIISVARRRSVGKGASLMRGFFREYTATGGGGTWTKLASASRRPRWDGSFERNIGSNIYHHPPLTKSERASGKKVKRLASRHRRDAKEKGFVFLGKLQNVFRYELVEADNPTAQVGLLPEYVGDSGFLIFQDFQRGGPVRTLPSGKTPFGPQANKYWGALNMLLKKTTKPRRPERKIVEPAFQKYGSDMLDGMRTSFLSAVAGRKTR